MNFGRLLVALFISFSWFLPAKTIYVQSQPGAGDGSAAKPLGGLKQLGENLARLNKNEAHRVIFREGNYFFDQGLDLSGLGADLKIAFSGQGKVCFTGAKTIPHKSFKKLTEPQLIERLISEAAKQNIVVVNLKQLGINDFGTIQRHGWCLESEHRTPPVFLSHGGQTLNLARWPNKDEASEYLCDRAKAVHIKGMVSYTSVVDKGASWDRSKTWHKDSEFMQGGGSFIVGFDRMKYWRDPQNIWIDGILSATWEWTYNHIKSIDVEKGQINLVHGELNGLGTKAKAPHFYFENIFEEIDQAGEYFLDSVH